MKQPTLDDLSREELLWLAKNKMLVRQDDINWARYRCMADRARRMMDDALATPHPVDTPPTKDAEPKVIIEWMKACNDWSAAFDKGSRLDDQAQKFFRTVVCPELGDED